VKGCSNFFEETLSATMMIDMRRAVRPVCRLAQVYVLLSLLVQFAPSIHLLSSHLHESATCTHGKIHLHLEAAPATDAPCLVCAHLLNSQVLAISLAVPYEIAFSAVSKTPTLETRLERPDARSPDNRGPPQHL
jgi:hypothetical protein